jgi:hypothetical protein
VLAELNAARQAVVDSAPDEEKPWGLRADDSRETILVDSVNGPVRVLKSQELPDGFDALLEPQRAAILRGEWVPVKRRCFVRGCSRKVNICVQPITLSDGTEGICGYSNCFFHGCRRGHVQASEKSEQKTPKPPPPPPKPPRAKKASKELPKREIPDDKAAQIEKIRGLWENGKSLKDIALDTGIQESTLQKYKADRLPDGKDWKPKWHGVRIEVLRDRPPYIFNWIRDVKWKINTRDDGGGWVDFDPWPVQMEIIEARLKKQARIIQKPVQVGITTAIQVADAYSFFWCGPFAANWVSKDMQQSKLRLKEINEMIDRAELPGWQRERYTTSGESIFYSDDRFTNNITCWAPTLGCARGIAGNAILMDEAAFMPYQQDIYQGFVGRLGDYAFNIMLVSSPNAYDDWFQYMMEHADEYGLRTQRLTHKARPDRGADFMDKQIARMGGDVDAALREHEGIRTQQGTPQFDMKMIRRYSQQHPWIGGQPIEGHRYSLGLDQSSSGEAETVCVIVDISTMPAQVVAVNLFEYNETLDIGRTLQKAQWTDRQAVHFPGQAFIDSTNEPGTVEMMQWPGKVVVRFRGSGVDKREDMVDGMRRVQWPRAAMLSNTALLLERGLLVVHEQFDTLYQALSKSRKSGEDGMERKTRFDGRPSRRANTKRLVKYHDALDALLLACLGLTDLSGGGNTEHRRLYTSKKPGQARRGWQAPRRRMW